MGGRGYILIYYMVKTHLPPVHEYDPLLDDDPLFDLSSLQPSVEHEKVLVPSRFLQLLPEMPISKILMFNLLKCSLNNLTI